jgi:5'-3' exonuclease
MKLEGRVTCPLFFLQGVKMILVIDYRNLVKNLSYSIMSGSIACAYPTEGEEIAHRVMKQFYSIRAEYPEATIILANDRRPYWRHKYLLDWYTAKGIEPVIYKGNRDKISWPFQTPPADMETVYAMLLEHAARAIGGIVIQDKGLEADDIFALVAVTTDEEVIGYSADSDWCQLVDGRVKIFDFTQGIMRTEKADIRIKWIGGDAGDNVKGCTKYKKNGEPMAKGWGKDGAKKLLEDHEWESKVDADELYRNKVVTTLPCPEWDAQEQVTCLHEVAVVYEQTDELWDRYGITANVRKLLSSQAERENYLKRLRMYLGKKEEEEV